MKKLMKAVAEKTLQAKFIWQNNNPEDARDSLPQEVESLHADTQERLKYLKEKSKSPYSEEKIKQISETVSSKADELQPVIEDLIKQDKTKEAAEKTKPGALSGKELSNLLRTELIARINNNASNLGVDDKSIANFFIEAMEGMAYNESCPTQTKLYYSMVMIKYGKSRLSKDLSRRFYGKVNRKNLAEFMEDNGENITMDGTNIINTKDGKYNITNFEILTGGAMTEIKTKYTEGFIIENAIFNEDKSQILATMKNGCRGNVVVIDISEKTVDPVVDPEPKTSTRCENGFVVIFNTETGEVIQKTDEKCKVTDDECVNCSTFESTMQADSKKIMNGMTDSKIIESAMENMFGEDLDESSAKDKWSSLKNPEDISAAVAFYKQAEAIKTLTASNEFAEKVLADGALRDRMEKMMNGRLLEGGVLGWLEQLGKVLFQNKDDAMKKRIEDDLGISPEDYNKMMNSMEEDVANASTSVQSLKDDVNGMSQEYLDKIAKSDKLKLYPKFQKAVEQGSTAQAKKMLLSDLFVTLMSMAIPPMGIPKDVSITNIRLPKWLGSELHRLPGMNAIAKTSLGEKLGGSYTETTQKALLNVDRSLEFGDNMAKLNAELTMQKANAQTTEENLALQARIDKINKYLDNFAGKNQELIDQSKSSYDIHSQAGLEASLRGKREHLSFFEGIFESNDQLGKKYRELKRSLRDANGEVDKDVFEKFKTFQKASVNEFNDDFGAAMEWDENSGELSNEFNATFRGFELKFINNNPENSINPKNITVEILSHRGESFSGMNEKEQTRLENKLNRILKRRNFYTRWASLREVSRGAMQTGASTEDYQNLSDQRDILDQVEGVETAEQNVISSSAFAVIKGMIYNKEFKEYLMSNNCPFSETVKGKLNEYIFGEGSDGRLSAEEFNTLWSNGLEDDYRNMIDKMGKALQSVEKNGSFTYIDSEGNVKNCKVNDLQNVLSEEKLIYIYDDLTGETGKRLPITLGMFKLIEKVTKTNKTTEIVEGNVEIEKSEQLLQVLQDAADGNGGYDLNFLNQALSSGLEEGATIVGVEVGEGTITIITQKMVEGISRRIVNKISQEAIASYGISAISAALQNNTGDLRTLNTNIVAGDANNATTQSNDQKNPTKTEIVSLTSLPSDWNLEGVNRSSVQGVKTITANKKYEVHLKDGTTKEMFFYVKNGQNYLSAVEPTVEDTKTMVETTNLPAGFTKVSELGDKYKTAAESFTENGANVLGAKVDPDTDTAILYLSDDKTVNVNLQSQGGVDVFVKE